ncbi:MAG TPA: P1 family peptidase, partial [bacterium]|nr:P1 family peptidase [bacterium]
GMTTYDFNGGIGTASRVLRAEEGGFTVGVLVQANHGTREELRIAGVPVGQEITDLMPKKPQEAGPPASSILTVIATDAPLLPHQCRRLAKRAPLGMARTGGTANNWSGDLFLAFSVANHPNRESNARTERWDALPLRAMDPLFIATIQATEEAIINALVAAETMTGHNGHTYHALPHDRLREVLRKYGRLRP